MKLPRAYLVGFSLMAAAFGRGAAETDLQATNQWPAVALLDQARTTRQEADDNLAQARQRQLEARQGLAAELQQAYDRLKAAEQQERQARERFQALQKRVERAKQAGAAFGPQADRVLSQASYALDVRLDGSRPITEIEGALSNALNARFERLEKAVLVTVNSERIVGRNGGHHELPVLRLGAFAAYACGSTPETCGLVRPISGSAPLVVGPELHPTQMALLQSAAHGSMTRLPLDVDGSLPERAPPARRTLRAWLAAGGIFIYPILLVALAGIVLTGERLVYLLATQQPSGLIEQVLDLLQRGAGEAAAERARTVRGPTARIALAGIKAHGHSADARETAMETALLAEAPRIERSLSLIAALASVAPLLGLLGTVSGMITAFNTIAAVGTGNPRLLSGGISEALITTQVGLMVGIPLLLFHAWLSRWAERREAMLECDAIQVFGLQKKEAPPG